MLLNKKFFNEKLHSNNIIVVFFFIIYFCIGSTLVGDYGIAFDEDLQRMLAQNRLDYIENFFSNVFAQSSHVSKKEFLIKSPEYGVAFELPALWLERIFGFSDTRSQFFFRHYLIFFVSFVGSIFFYLLSLKRIKSWKLALLGTIFLVSSPRIFAESFYNSKDIVFMYIFLINTFFVINFLEKPNKSAALSLAFVSALCIGTRIGGIVLTILALYFLSIKYLRKDYNFKIIGSVLIFLFFLILFVILFWPSLWENPINNFLGAITSFKNYEHKAFNFYLGNFVFSSANYWHYVPLWICITTPIFIIIFFIYGFSLSVRRVLYRLVRMDHKNSLNDLWRGSSEFHDLIFMTLVFMPIFLTIVFKSTLYSGWRHLYFIYPFIILIGLNALKIIYIRINLAKMYNIKKILNLAIFIFVISNFYWLNKNHPFQNNYFNFLAGEKPHNNFEVDYWGLSNKFVLDKILSEDNSQNINISAISVTSLEENFNILTSEQKERIQYSKDLKSSDYIINNNIFILGDKNKLKKLPSNFDIYYELFIDDILVTTIYKRNDLI